LDYGHVITFSAFGPAPVDLRYSQWSQNYVQHRSTYATRSDHRTTLVQLATTGQLKLTDTDCDRQTDRRT